MKKEEVRQIKIFDNVKIENCGIGENCSIGDNARIINSTIGRNCKINRNNFIEATTIKHFSYTGRNTHITHANVGAFTSISWNVSIGGAQHDYSLVTQHPFPFDEKEGIVNKEDIIDFNYFTLPVNIGSDVWIGSDAVVLRGVTIGDGAVVGANSVVTKDIPPYAIAAGSPAKVIKYRFNKEVIDILLKLKWWYWSEKKIKENLVLLSKKPNIEKLKLALKNI